MNKDEKVILTGMLILALITVVFIIVQSRLAKPNEPSEAAGVIIVDPRHKVVVYDTENGRSWKAFKYQGTLVLIPGTEVQE